MVKKEIKKESTEVKEVKNFEKSGKISEFFNHLVAYGGFNIQDGVMKVWGDPSLFIPINAFVFLFHELEEKLGKDKAHEIFYWLGRLYGKNCTLMLANRYGISKKDIPNFINGATQDGMGLVQLIKETQLKNGHYIGEIEGDNSIFAKEYSKKYGKQDNPVDFYLLGILCGGGEPLYGKPIRGEEKECMVQGGDKCIYELKTLDKIPQFEFFIGTNLSEEEILKRTNKLMLNRKSDFKFIGKKEVRFGDGSFSLKGLVGINFPVYGIISLNKILMPKLKEKYERLLSDLSENYFRNIENNFKKKELIEILKELEIFGYGKFEIKVAGQKKVIISNSNNPYPKDYAQLFGRSKEPVDFFPSKLIEQALKLNDKNCSVKETTCMARGDKTCTFEVTFF